MNEPRPEHRKLNPHDDGITNLGRFDTKLRCTNCKPHRTLPVRKDGDPDTVVRCAQCGKKHSTENVEA